MKKLLFGFLVLSFTGLFAQNIIRVNINVGPTGARDGSSWPNARKHLQGALNVAQPGDEIWVAQGTYYPTVQNGLSFYARDISYKLVDGVAIYGGFDATETQRQQRDWRKNETILSGDIGVVNDPSDNCFHVVLAEANITSPNTILDGFTVRDGRNEQGRGVDKGGGILVWDGANVILKNLVIEDNITIQGAGLTIYNSIATVPSSDSVLIANCLIRNNVAHDLGGGVYVNDRNTKFYNCIILNNVANNPNPGFITYADGIYLGSNNVACLLANCTFGLFDTLTIHSGSTFKAYNSVMPGILNYSVAPSVDYRFKNCIIKNSGGSTNWNSPADGTDLGGNLDVNPGLWAYDNPALRDTSQARDAGSNADLPADEADIDDDGNVTEALPLDFYGNPRIFFGRVDIGATEYTPVKLDTVYHSICEYDIYNYGSQALTLPGTYIKTLISNPAGDTAEVLHLSVDSINTQIHIEPDGTYISHEDSATYYWIDCANADTVQSGSNQIFKPTKNGEYGVYIKNSLGCIRYSLCLEIKNVGISESALGGFSLYPNPVRDKLILTIENPGAGEDVIKVYDLMGKLVLEKALPEQAGQIEIDVRSLEPAVYFIGFNSARRAFVKI